jgi:hypothetical protein
MDGTLGIFLLAIVNGLLLLCRVDAVDVTSATGVLAYTMESGCPTGWVDLAADAFYPGRLIKGWNPSNNAGIGFQHISTASSSNVVLTHTHTILRTVLTPGVSGQAPIVGGSSPSVLTFQNAVTISGSCGAASGMTAPSSNIQSEF